MPTPKTGEKHTEGPWKLNSEYVHAGPDHHIVAAVNQHLSREGEANGRLIAVAPLMFDFIKRLADDECYQAPGEYPTEGESGKAPCLSCEAKTIIAKANQGGI